MTEILSKQCTVFAPAKINLFLHITGKRKNGYHTLDSLITFADIGDQITIEPHEHFAFEVTGQFAPYFSKEDTVPYLDGRNLVTRAAKNLLQAAHAEAKVKITLEKNLPLAAGLGGGSSDAAAVIWGLNQFLKLDAQAPYLTPLLLKLGADVPVCYRCMPTVVRGIGEDFTPAPDMPEMAVLLVNPMKPCPTPDVFLKYKGAFHDPVSLPSKIKNIGHLADILKGCKNDLYAPACQTLPEIKNIIATLDGQEGCVISRMSGSGASCFGIFENSQAAQKAAKAIKAENPDWWVANGHLNRPERY